MDSQVVVWNLDARNRPELEVEIDILYAPEELPGVHYARRRTELEVELEIVTTSTRAIEVIDSSNILDLSDHALLDDDDLAPIRDLPPHGYAHAYASARPRRPARITAALIGARA